MKLWLLRHAEAEPLRSDDASRCLTPYGHQQAKKAGDLLKRAPLNVLLVSPYLRAQQTADEVCERIQFSGSRVTVPWLTPDADLREVLARLEPYEHVDMLLVSHQPLVGELAGWLVEGNRRQALAMATASLAELEGEAFAGGLMTLKSLTHSMSN